MIFDKILAIGNTWLEGKNDVAKAELAAKLVNIQADSDIKKAKAIAALSKAEKGQDQDFNLDRLAMENMEKSYKDEYILGLLSTPIIMSFIPTLAPYALAGFQIISQMPEWFRYLFIGVVVVIYGMRGMLTKLLDRKLPKL